MCIIWAYIIYNYIYIYCWHDMTWDDMRWRDMTWHNMTSHDITWHDMTWRHCITYIILYIYIYIFARSRACENGQHLEGVTLQHELRVMITPTEGVEVSLRGSLCMARCMPSAIAVQKKTISLAGKRSRTYDSRGSGWQFILKHLHLCRICGKHLPSCLPKTVVHDYSKLSRSISVWILRTEHPATHRL